MPTPTPTLIARLRAVVEMAKPLHDEMQEATKRLAQAVAINPLGDRLPKLLAEAEAIQRKVDPLCWEALDALPALLDALAPAPAGDAWNEAVEACAAWHDGEALSCDRLVKKQNRGSYRWNSAEVARQEHERSAGIFRALKRTAAAQPRDDGGR